MNVYSWNVEKLDDPSIKKAGKNCLKNYGDFIKSYSTSVRNYRNQTYDLPKRLGPIRIGTEPREQSHLLQLICTENTVLSKVVSLLTTLSVECRKLRQAAYEKYFPALLFYGENGVEELEQGQPLEIISQFLSMLQETSAFVKRCDAVVRSILHQFASLYTSSQIIPKVMNTSNVHFTTLFEDLASLLSLFVVFDEIIENQAILREHWMIYKRMVNSLVQGSVEDYSVTPADVSELRLLVNTIDEDVFSACSFQNCVTQTFDEGSLNVSKNTCFSSEFHFNLKTMILNLSNDNIRNMYKIVDLSALYVLYHNIYKQTDNKITRALMDIYKKYPGTHLIGLSMWFGPEFLSRNMPSIPKDNKLIGYRHTWLTNQTTNLAKEIETLTYKVQIWMMEFSSKHLDARTIDKGVCLAYTVRHLLSTLFTFHVTMATPISKKTICHLCEGLEMLKAIEDCYNKKCFHNEMVHHIKKFTTAIMQSISSAIKKINLNNKYNEGNLDTLSALYLCEKLLAGPATKDRILLIKMTLPIASTNKIFNENELLNINMNLQKLEIYSNFDKGISESCNTDFIYWNQGILPAYLNTLFNHPGKADKLKYIVKAFEDSLPNPRYFDFLKDKNELNDNFTDFLSIQLDKKLLVPLVARIENHLRLLTHSHLDLDQNDVFKTAFVDNRPLLDLEPIHTFHKVIDIKAYVERRLDESFYNLTAVALHDWSTYQSMKTQAKRVYGLHLIDYCLPNQTLDQGLDVLELMRNINVFVARYHYNLNNQIFIEHSSNSKHLNTINIGHISNSLRTHGRGIVNTTINYTYQFLKKKFFTFSQFMFDEHIKSRLVKDLRYFKDNLQENKQKYLFSRAVLMDQSIRKLGLNSKSQSYLDQFRKLITEIGNSLAYIRLMRSGTLHHCAKSIRFLTKVEDDDKEDCYRKQLHEVKNNLQQNFTDGDHYFQLLVNVFTKEFCSNKNSHLRNFYIILPGLTLNYVEYMITSKDKLSRSNKQGAIFTDDGFSIGVAYILKLLKQDVNFQSLHWFESLKEKYAQDKKTAETSKESKQTLTLTLKRIENYETEFNLLYYSMNSARIFFKQK